MQAGVGSLALNPAFSSDAPEQLPVVERVPGTAPVPGDSPARSGLARTSSGQPTSARGRLSLFARSPASTPARPASAAVHGTREPAAPAPGRHVSFDGVDNMAATAPR